MDDFYARAAGCSLAGPALMRSSASIQANVESGLDPDARTTGSAGRGAGRPSGSAPVIAAEDRWDLLHAVGPALVAAVANSPRLHGVRTGWRSARQWIWVAAHR